MAGFQVANFSFGKNIRDDERQRMQTATQAATTRRGQDMQAAQADANRMEEARQFDERMAQQQSAQEEGARQFDKTQAFKEREYADRRGDVERAQSWDDALKLQQMEKEEQETENRRLAFETQNARLEAFLKMKVEEDAQMENRRAAMEGNYGNMAILAHLQNGTVTRRQVDEFNRILLKDGMIDEGGEYNYIGVVDQTTGKPFADGKLHFMRYALDKNGHALRDEKTGQPVVEVDNPLNTEIRNAALSSYFGNVKEFMGAKGGMSEERMQLERDRLYHRGQEEQGRASRARAKGAAANARLAASVARNMGDLRRGLGLTDEQAASFRTSLTRILSDAFNPQDGADADGAATPSTTPLSSNPYENRSVKTGEDGRTYEVVRSSTGAVIGKREVKEDGAAAQPQTTARPGDNGGNRTAGDEPPGGRYRVQKDGISYHWGKSKSGKWGYFPDK